MTTVLGFDDDTNTIEWIDGTLRVSPESEQERVQGVFADPVQYAAATDRVGADGAPEAIEDGFATIEPGSPEHAARAVLSLPGGTLILGDEFIPDEEPPLP